MITSILFGLGSFVLAENIFAINEGEAAYAELSSQVERKQFTTKSTEYRRGFLNVIEATIRDIKKICKDHAAIIKSSAIFEKAPEEDRAIFIVWLRQAKSWYASLISDPAWMKIQEYKDTVDKYRQEINSIMGKIIKNSGTLDNDNKGHLMKGNKQIGTLNAKGKFELNAAGKAALADPKADKKAADQKKNQKIM